MSGPPPPSWPTPQRGNEGYRCGTCGHRVKTHWYDRADSRFRDHPRTYWCQICGAYCPDESVLTPRAKAARERFSRKPQGSGAGGAL